MALPYDIGKKEGREEGREEGRVAVARNLLKQGIPIEVIVNATGLTPEVIRALR